MLRPPSSPKFWLAGIVLWFALLWYLSSKSDTNEALPAIPNIDKIAHFGYFFGGGGLIAAYLFRRKPIQPDWRRIILTTVVILGTLAALDELHQSYTPGRSGNDLYDWLADVSGDTCGALVLRAIHRWFK